MALKKGISYQWRVFVPVLVCFWTVIIAMAFWQVYRVRELKQDEVFNQLMFVGERMRTFYDNNRSVERIEAFADFVDMFYDEQPGYDKMSILVLDPAGNILYKNGSIFPRNTDIIDNSKTTQLIDIFDANERAFQGIADYTGEELEGTDERYKFLYYTTVTNRGNRIYTLLPYTKEVTKLVSANTTKFWLIFFSIAIFGTIFVYISSSFFGRNIRVLRDFANQAAENPDFVWETADLPHDELGEISRKIISLYNQRVEQMERREREHLVALHAIEEKERIKRDLTSNINHELKTPVGVIQGYIDTLVDNPDMDIETRDRFLYKAQASVHRLTSLITDITVITKLESGGKLINVEPINFHDLVFTFENSLGETGLLRGKLKFNYDVPLDCMILGNDSLLTSVITNLVKNAVSYSKGTECCLELVGEDKDYYKFRFYDDGVGVAPEHLPHMFERFFRVNSGRSRDTGGTGLGLAIVQVTIESLGGTIEVVNRFPSGLQFNFSLPKYKGRKHGKHHDDKKHA